MAFQYFRNKYINMVTKSFIFLEEFQNVIKNNSVTEKNLEVKLFDIYKLSELKFLVILLEKEKCPHSHYVCSEETSVYLLNLHISSSTSLNSLFFYIKFQRKFYVESHDNNMKEHIHSYIYSIIIVKPNLCCK